MFVIIHSSTILLPLWFATLDKLKLDMRKMPQDVRTWWNSTFTMLEFAVQYHEAIDDIAGNKTANLHCYEMSEVEWKISGQLCDVLKVHSPFGISGTQALTCLQVLKMQHFSFCAQHPTLPTVIPAMDLIDETLTTQSCKHKFEVSIWAALGITKKTQQIL